MGMGDKLFAIPWSALTVDKVEKRFILNVEKELLKRAPGFDKDHWPNMADRAWGTQVFKYYRAKPYFRSIASVTTHPPSKIGGSDGTRTRGLLRDRQAFYLPDCR